MKKRILGAALLLAMAGGSLAVVPSALAFPSQTSRCAGCHGGAWVALSAKLAAITGSTATYNVSAPGASAIAIFDGATKRATIAASSSRFAVTVGRSYTVYAVRGPSTSNGIGSVTVKPMPRVTPTMSMPAAPAVVGLGKAFSVYGTLKPVHALGASPVLVQCYHLENGKWVLRVNVRTRIFAGTGASVYRGAAVLGLAGSWHLRAYHPTNLTYNSAYSPIRTITAK